MLDFNEDDLDLTYGYELVHLDRMCPECGVIHVREDEFSCPYCGEAI